MSLNIILIGALGRMGREIAELIFLDEKLALTGTVEYSNHTDIGKDYGACIGKGALGIKLSKSLMGIDSNESVAIDFSSPQSLQQNLPEAAKKRLPMVIGTTGLCDEDIENIKRFSTDIPLLVSPNMSLGINILFLLTEIVSRQLKDDFDIEILEAHHRFKKDSPSGTAKRLGEIAAESIGMTYESCIRDGRQGLSPNGRTKKEIGMHAIRGGDIVGDHTVLFAGIGERIELRHIAHSRTILARGALSAAKWLSVQKPGLYSMRDMLHL